MLKINTIVWNCELPGGTFYEHTAMILNYIENLDVDIWYYILSLDEL
jgi:hypothetical protein